MIVLDASAAGDALLNTDERGRQIRERLRSDPRPNAPHLIDVEFLSLLRARRQERTLGPDRIAAALRDFRLMPLRRFATRRLLGRIWELRENLTPYDAAYVALAEALDAPLVTTDGRLARAPGHSATIELYPR